MPRKPKTETTPLHQDQRINVSGRGRTLAVGKTLPTDWEWVRVTVLESKDNEVTLHIRRLVLNEA
ncbi:MAG: hypothetical protein IIB17_11070 [Chloroflexi bacterium]|nr:hypothetical protein [Chloroflexota bacterium]